MLTALVILTERNPAASMRVVYVRYIPHLVPLSVVFIAGGSRILDGLVEASRGAQLAAGVTRTRTCSEKKRGIWGSCCLVLLFDLMETQNAAPPLEWIPNAGFALPLKSGIGFTCGPVQQRHILCSAADWASAVVLGKRLTQRANAGPVFIAAAFTIALSTTLGVTYADRFSEELGRGEGLSGGTRYVQRMQLKKFGEE